MLNHKIQKLFIKISQGIWLDSVETIISICRASVVSIIYNVRLQSVGTGLRLRGAKCILVGKNVVIGRFNWIEAVIKYGNKIYSPKITIGNHVALSDFVHISSVSEIVIGDGTLIGSKVYIGDHNHGFGSDQNTSSSFPA